MKIMRICGADSTFSRSFLTTWEGLIRISDDGRFNGIVVDFKIPEDSDIFELNSKNKTNFIKGSLRGKILDFTVFKDEKSMYEYKLLKLDSSYYGENFIAHIKTYKKNIDLESIKPFLYSKVSLLGEYNYENLEENIYACLTNKDQLIYILNDLMEKYETSTISDTFHRRAMVKVKDCFMKK